MRYIKSFENFKPIKINNAKPFKVKKNLDTNIRYLQKGIKSLRGRIEKQKSAKKRSEMNKDISKRIQKLGDVTFKQLKQAEYLKNNPVKENLDNDEESTVTLLSILKSPDFKPEDILNHIGLDEGDYLIETEYNYHDHTYENTVDKDGFTLLMKSRPLEELMDIENGFIDYVIRVATYYDGYTYDAEEDELNYLDRFLSEEVIAKIVKLAKMFKFNIDTEEDGGIRKFFEYLNLDDDLQEFKTDIENEVENAVKKSARQLIESLPFGLDLYHKKDMDLELIFGYSTMIEYMEKHKMEVSNIKEFLENIHESKDFDYNFEYEGKYEFLDDYKDLNTTALSTVDDYIDSPETIFPKLIEHDNIVVFKKFLKYADFIYEYSNSIWDDARHGKNDKNLFEIAIHYNGKILKWFKTYNFQKKIIDEDDADVYKKLIEFNIIDPKIREEYRYLIDVDKFNL